MVKVYLVTGTPGTGKTTFAEHFAEKHGAEYIDVTLLIKEKHIFEEYDEKRDCVVVDVDKLVEVLQDIYEHAKHDLVIDSHLSHFFPAHLTHTCFVTKCSLPELRERLEQRGYSPEKVRENLDAEIFDICRIEAEEEGHVVEIIETGKKIEDVAASTPEDQE